uniref:Gustatory receptor n=1 Tax=Parascaris univalens TaxID=6257 RepID=A0A915CH39_PARUN
MPSISTVFSPCNFKRIQACGKQEIDEEAAPTSHMGTHYKHTNGNSMLRAVIENQWAYAQYMKLVTLFVIAVTHVIYMSSFLKAFSALVDFTDAVEGKATASEFYSLRHQVDLLADYRKNMWMTVGSMCVALSTLCFFLLLNASAQKATYVVAMRIVDLVAFSTLPALLFARWMLVESATEHLPVVLHQMQHMPSPNLLTSALNCSMTATENVRQCSAAILDSLFPAFLIKYLIVLAILTIIYVVLAYIIEWCIRHLFPPEECHHRPQPRYSPIIITDQ